MKEQTKSSSNIAEKLMDCNKSDLPKGLSPKIVAAEKNYLNTKPKIDSPLLKKIDPDLKRVEELSAKEQESRRKFKEKINKLKKMPMPPQPTINVNSEGLTEGELTIENMKRKFKQIFSKLFKESLPSAIPELEKSVEKKQPNAIKICVGTKPIDSAIYRFACVLPIKRNVASASKKIESMICKSVGLLPEQYVNNNQILLISKDKQDKTISSSTITGNSDPIGIPPNDNKGNPKSTPIKIEEKNKMLETKDKITPPSTPDSSLSTLTSTDTTVSTPAVATATVAPTSTAASSLATAIATSTFQQLNSTATTTSTSIPTTATSNTTSSLMEATAPAKPTTTPTISPATPTATASPTTVTPAPAAASSTSTATSTIPSASPSFVCSDDQILLPKKVKKSVVKPTIDLAPDDKLKTSSSIISAKTDKPEKRIELVTKSKFPEAIKKIEQKEPPKMIEPVRAGPLASLIKTLNLDKIFKSISKSKDTKFKMIPFSVINKIPIGWKQGFVIIGTFIPLYYTYHKIVTDNQLTLKLTEEN